MTKTSISTENIWFLSHIHVKAYSFLNVQFYVTFPNNFEILEAKNLHDMMKFLFSHLEEKHSTFFPHMETHPNVLTVCIVIPYNKLFPMN